MTYKQQESYDLAYDILALEAVDREEMRQLVAEVIDFDRAATIEKERNAGWISVDERLPEPDTLVIIPGGVGFYRDGVWRTRMEPGDPIIQWEVKYWMPIPRPPAENET